MDANLLAEDIEILRETIRANDGANVAGGAFARKVEALISAFYDDLGELSGVRLSDILDLFLIKVLYVNRQSRDAQTLRYLGNMMARLLQTSGLALNEEGATVPYLSDLLQETGRPGVTPQAVFDVCRKYGDNALFLSGMFPQGVGRRRAPGILGGAPLVDRNYFVTMGRRYYGMAASHDAAEWVHLRTTLLRLAQFFDVYVDALNEMSGRYVMGMDMRLIADKMLDAFNRYRETRDAGDLETARKYAALMKLEGYQWPALGGMDASPPAPTYY